MAARRQAVTGTRCGWLTAPHRDGDEDGRSGRPRARRPERRVRAPGGTVAASGTVAGTQVRAEASQTGKRAWRQALQPIPDVIDWYMDHKALGILLVGAFLIVKGVFLAKGDIATRPGCRGRAGGQAPQPRRAWPIARR